MERNPEASGHSHSGWPAVTAWINSIADDLIDRPWLVEEIAAWRNSPVPLLKIVGPPGTGKTAFVALWSRNASVRDRIPLHAVHFCQQTSTESIRPSQIFTAISSQLAATVPGYFEYLMGQEDARRIIDVRVEQHVGSVAPGGVVIGAQFNLASTDMEGREAFDRLVRGPLAALADGGSLPHGVLIVIDAMDEAVEAYRGAGNLAALLRRELNHPIPGVQWLITSRPSLAERNLSGTEILLNERRPQIAEDLARFIAHWRPAIGATDVTRLAEASNGNFLYAKYMINGISDDAVTLPGSLPASKEMYDVYAEFLRRELSADRDAWRARFRPILGVLAAAREQGADADLIASAARHLRSSITDSEVDDVLEICDPFLLRGPSGMLTIYHPSFRDYLRRRGEHFVYPGEANVALAWATHERWKGAWQTCTERSNINVMFDYLIASTGQSEGAAFGVAEQVFNDAGFVLSAIREVGFAVVLLHLYELSLQGNSLSHLADRLRIVLARERSRLEIVEFPVDGRSSDRSAPTPDQLLQQISVQSAYAGLHELTASADALVRTAFRHAASATLVVRGSSYRPASSDPWHMLDWVKIRRMAVDGRHLIVAIGDTHEGRYRLELRHVVGLHTASFWTCHSLRDADLAPESDRAVIACEHGHLSMHSIDAEEAEVPTSLADPSVCRFSPCGRYLVIGSSDGAFEVRARDTGELTGRFEIDGFAAVSVVFPGDAASAVAIVRRDLPRETHLTDPGEYRVVSYRFADAAVSTVLASPDNPVTAIAVASRSERILAAFQDGTVKMFNAAGTEVESFISLRAGRWLDALQIDESGFVALVKERQGAYQSNWTLWDLTRDRKILPSWTMGGVVRLSHDGKLFAAAESGQLQVHAVADGRTLLQFYISDAGRVQHLYEILFSLDDRFLVTSTAEKHEYGSWYAINTFQTDGVLPDREMSDDVAAFAATTRPSELIAVSSGGVIFRKAGATELEVLGSTDLEHPTSLAVSADCALIAVGGTDSVDVFAIDPWERIQRIEVGQDIGTVYRVSLRIDSEHLTVAYRGSAGLWDVRTGERIRAVRANDDRGADRDFYTSLILAEDIILRGGWRPTQLFHLTSGRTTTTGFRVQENLTTDPHGEWLAYSSGNTVFLRTANDGGVPLALPDHRAPILRIWVSAHGRFLLTTHEFANTLFVWDTEQVRARRQARETQTPLRSILFNHGVISAAPSPVEERQAFVEAGRDVWLIDW